MALFDGKTLLMLGSNIGADEMVVYARENGAHTIVADYYPPERSAAKRVADEDVLVSTADLNALDRLIEERHVDGVLAGISEFNLLNAMELCRRHDLPFYCTQEQWDAVERKDGFRTLCERHGVPCPKTFFSGARVEDIPWEEIAYPVVLKPVDAASSVGVFFCSSESDLKRHLQQSLASSGSGRIIIESREVGEEFTAHFTICGGRATFSCIDNRYPVSVHAGDVTTVPVARIYPSLFTDEFEKQVCPQMIRLCEGLGLQDGVLFIQGLYDEDANTFSVFEAGLRSAGEAPCRFLQMINGVNYLHVLVQHALLGKAEFDAAAEDCRLGGHCAGVVSFVARGAEVGAIEGLEEAVEATPSVISFESRYPVGSTTPDGDTLRQLMIRFIMVSDDREQMSEDIAYLNGHVAVTDVHGENMVLKMDPERIFGIH